MPWKVEQIPGGGWRFFDAEGHERARYAGVEVMAQMFAFVLQDKDRLAREVATLKACRRLDPGDLPASVPAFQKQEALTWLVAMAWKHEELGDSRAAEILGTDIVSAREVLRGVVEKTG